jgi:diadenosine tetraphosphate (Ap4A) HIT family hydrolase
VNLYCFENAKPGTKRDDMAALEAAGVCLFCPEHLASQQPVDYWTDHWAVTPSEYPYEGTTHHLLLVPRIHAESLLALPLYVLADFWTALSAARAAYALAHFTVAVRNGDARCTGATIRHVHVHLIQAGAPAEPAVKFRCSGRPGTVPVP